MTTIELRAVSFGESANEQESDDFFSNAFVPTHEYEKIRSGKHFLVLGNRGTGKSAVLRRLLQDSTAEGKLSIRIHAADTSLDSPIVTLANDVKQNGQPDNFKDSLVASWKFVIYSRIAQAIGKSLSNKLVVGPHAVIYNHAKNLPGFTNDFVGMIFDRIKALRHIRLEGISVGINKEEQRIRALGDVSQLADAINEYANATPIIVVFDELDSGWTNSLEQNELLHALFQAALWFNRNCNGIKVYLSLRSEIYNSIPSFFLERQKHYDFTQTLAWNEPGLRNLIARRMEVSLERVPTGSDEVWYEVFAPKFGKQDSFKYLLNRTLSRPREIINLCDRIVNRAIIEDAKPPLPRDLFASIEEEYSMTWLEDVASEWWYEYPNLKIVFGTFATDVSGLKNPFPCADLESHATSVVNRELTLGDSEVESWVTSCDPRSLIDILWKTAFLQVFHDMRWHSCYRKGPNFYKGKSLFRVHPMFKKAVGIVNFKKAGNDQDSRDESGVDEDDEVD